MSHNKTTDYGLLTLLANFVKSSRFTLWELGGAFGDLGTLLPLLVALVLVKKVSSSGAFLVIGLAYILAGLYYRVPISVQPLKSVSAIAIAMGLSASVISASGLLMAGLLLFLAATGIIGIVAKPFPKPVVGGIQLSPRFCPGCLCCSGGERPLACSGVWLLPIPWKVTDGKINRPCVRAGKTLSPFRPWPARKCDKSHIQRISY